MELLETINVRELFRESPTFHVEEVKQLIKALSGAQTADVRQELDSLKSDVDASNSPADTYVMRVGVGLYLVGRHPEADDYLGRVPNDPVGAYFHAMVLLSLERPGDAEGKFAQAGRGGYDPVDCKLRQAGAIRIQGRVTDAEELLRSTASEGATRAEYSYQMGCILSDQGDRFGAIEYFERAVDMDPHHSRALFSLANENCLHGNDDEAIRLYERSLSKPPQHIGTLLNLGLLYEDAENYSAAAFCFRRILETQPHNEQARLYLKDIEATNNMYYDEETARNEARMQHLLNRPVTDFELTVRSRNCLENIDIRTLGDLTRVTEQELLSGKNFGETSLLEIRDLMATHGLKIGQNIHQSAPRDSFASQDLSPEEQALQERPISDLNLSVRARKCMARLGITNLGELVRRTPDELLASKNFGVTSLNEIRTKLTELGTKLRND
ncbi:MAG: DNA-directed RNA polymerase subunit alpha [Planctomycetaceae bacterium]|nr:DNA-directed RNA polymerase subunit alpha [Planctomycetaceae bacterium]